MRLRGFHRKFEFTPSELGEIPSPVLLIWGTNDPFGSIASGKNSADYIATAEFHQVGTGHFPWLDAPKRCAKLIQEFLPALMEVNVRSSLRRSHNEVLNPSSGVSALLLVTFGNLNDAPVIASSIANGHPEDCAAIAV